MKNFSFGVFIVIMLISGCGKNNSELWYEAVDLQNNKKTDDALEKYLELVDRFPESYEAPKAMFQIAVIYHTRGMNQPDQVNLKKAVEYFTNVYEDYPSSKEAPQALFMVGFIQSNDLYNFDEAKKIYSLFLKKYPTHEMRESAQKEIDNMGLTPEEILKRNLQASK